MTNQPLRHNNGLEHIGASLSLPVVQRQDDAFSAAADVCPECGGFNFVRRELPLDHADFGKVHPCYACVSGRQPAVAVGIPEGLAAASFDNFSVTLQPGMALAFSRCSKVASGEAWCAMLEGPPGIGKTHLAVAALSESVHAKPGQFFTHAGLLMWIRERMDLDGKKRADLRESEDEVILFFQTNPAMLVIDDLGTAKASPWAQQTLYEILNGRYERRLPTILTLNTAAPGLVLDERITSRFFEGGVDCEGTDYRKRAGGN